MVEEKEKVVILILSDDFGLATVGVLFNSELLFSETFVIIAFFSSILRFFFSILLILNSLIPAFINSSKPLN
jgi:hypothetical protein